ncbi:hypothetical protein [Ferrovum sp. JA12]|uniref:hypothetical protein n=1 Tax=Ferrovum sp. JA12 TaxID=1356299 RepID=UPI00128F7EBF|nr:hypothetical protein [Ferrovum sp. JA12]
MPTVNDRDGLCQARVVALTLQAVSGRRLRHAATTRGKGWHVGCRQGHHGADQSGASRHDNGRPNGSGQIA